MHDLTDHHVELPSGDYATIAGLVLDHLGRIPEAGERFEIADRTIEVRGVRHHTITAVAIHPPS